MSERNLNLDVLRGIAAFSVVANHVMSHFEGFAGSMLGNINFSLQNPLFMMVAGFSLIYTKPITDTKTCMAYIKKRSIMLLLPWVVWSLLLYALTSDNSFIEHIGYTAYHMEGAYWFLFALWTMSIVYSISALICKKLRRNNIGYIVAVSSCSMFLMVSLCLIAWITVGIDFMAIKLSTYYFPFYLLGWIIAEVMKQDWSDSMHKVLGVFICFAFIAYTYIIAKYDIPSIPDTLIIVRILASIFGCLVLFQAVLSCQINPNSLIAKALSWGGAELSGTICSTLCDNEIS